MQVGWDRSTHYSPTHKPCIQKSYHTMLLCTRPPYINLECIRKMTQDLSHTNTNYVLDQVTKLPQLCPQFRTHMCCHGSSCCYEYPHEQPVGHSHCKPTTPKVHSTAPPPHTLFLSYKSYQHKQRKRAINESF